MTFKEQYQIFIQRNTWFGRVATVKKTSQWFSWIPATCLSWHWWNGSCLRPQWSPESSRDTYKWRHQWFLGSSPSSTIVLQFKYSNNYNKYINQTHCSFLNLNNMKSFLTLLPITMHQFKFCNKSNVKWNYPYKTENYLRFLSFVCLFLYIPLSPSSSLPKEFCLSRASSLNDVSTSIQQ